MRELRVIFSEAHSAGSGQNLKRIIEQDWPAITIIDSDTGIHSVVEHICPECRPEIEAYFSPEYQGRHRVSSSESIAQAP